MIKTIKSRMRWVTHAAHMQQIKINTQIWSENLKEDLCIDGIVSVSQQPRYRPSEHDNKH
jgi:hypothetical protein